MNQNKSQDKIKTKAVRSKRMAWLLRKVGFPIISVKPDRCKPEYDVYIFEKTLDFQKAFDKIIEESKEPKT